MMHAATPLLSVVIKTLDEEQKIARAIESALRVQDEIDGALEVVVADSMSADRTVEIASRYPVRIVQLKNPHERGCGTGVELGYQHARGRYVYFLDGDMQIVPGFMPAALRTLAADLRLAGVGGLVQDTQIVNGEDRIRVNNRAVTSSGPSPWLAGGGLYRRAAIGAAGGYAADRNLKGFEEAELGMRLQSAGWALVRLSRAAVTHTGHSLSGWQLLVRHWRSRRAMSGGVLLRGAIGKPWLLQACRMLAHPLALMLFWGLLVLVCAWAEGQTRATLLAGWCAMAVLGFVAVWAKKRDLRHASYSVCSWHFVAIATVVGLFMAHRSPLGSIACVVVQDTQG